MPARKGQLVGAKNGMYGKHHDKAARKKMSDAVRKAYKEGRLEGMSEYCRKLGRIASKKKQKEESELWSNKIISYIMWLFNHTFVNEPSFADSYNALEEALDVSNTEPQSKYWTALLQIDFDKVKQNIAEGKVARAFASINYFIAPLCPDEAGVCYERQYFDNFNSETINSMVADYVTWMIENRNKLENYMIKCYALNGNHKAQYLEILKRRSRSSWGDQSKSLEVKTTTNKNTEDKTLEIKIVEV
jgi:hypothetical protein